MTEATDWLAQLPWWLPGLVSLAASPVGMVLVALLAERRMLWPREQYVSFFYGDLGLALAAVLSGRALGQGSPAPEVTTTPAWYLGCLVASALFGYVTFRADASATIPSGPRRGSLVYSRRQLISPTKLFHNGPVAVVLGLVLGGVTVPFLLSAPLPEPGRAPAWLAVLGLVLFWIVGALWWDGRHHKPHAHVEARAWWIR